MERTEIEKQDTGRPAVRFDEVELLEVCTFEDQRAEVAAIKRIIRERIIPGKCDECEGVHGCTLTTGQRKLCARPFSYGKYSDERA